IEVPIKVRLRSGNITLPVINPVTFIRNAAKIHRAPDCDRMNTTLTMNDIASTLIHIRTGSG
ncbi:MAG: hypothetical protein IIA75_04670, partial [Proteobacteria bacterium]|nr:hypothetical protein [Pseudomonadota bacterium]